MTSHTHLFKDDKGRWRTQSLFLENNYGGDAMYTLKDSDYEYKGTVYKSLKQLFINEEDTVEYEFANKYLGGWQHWKRICANKLYTALVDEWREELELKLRAKGVKRLIDRAINGDSYQAEKYLADRGFLGRKAGAPSKLEKEKGVKQTAHIADEYASDLARLQ